MKYRYYIIFLFTLFPDIVAYLAFLLLYAICGKRLYWHRGLVVMVDPGSWFRRHLMSRYAGGAFGHCAWYLDGMTDNTEAIDTTIERHEHVHIEQFEVFAVTGFIIGIAAAICCSAPILFFGIWFITSPLSVISGWFVAWLRGVDVYRGSMHERSAYALDDDDDWIS